MEGIKQLTLYQYLLSRDRELQELAILHLKNKGYIKILPVSPQQKVYLRVIPEIIHHVGYLTIIKVINHKYIGTLAGQDGYFVELNNEYILKIKPNFWDHGGNYFFSYVYI